MKYDKNKIKLTNNNNKRISTNTNYLTNIVCAKIGITKFGGGTGRSKYKFNR